MLDLKCPQCGSTVGWLPRDLRSWLRSSWTPQCHVCGARFNLPNPLAATLAWGASWVGFSAACTDSGSLAPWRMPGAALLVCYMTFVFAFFLFLRHPPLAPQPPRVSEKARCWGQVAVWSGRLFWASLLVGCAALWAYARYTLKAASALPVREAVALFDRTQIYLRLLACIPAAVCAVAVAVGILGLVMRRRALKRPDTSELGC